MAMALVSAFATVAQLAEAPDSKPGQCGFESHPWHLEVDMKVHQGCVVTRKDSNVKGTVKRINWDDKAEVQWGDGKK